MSAETPPDHIDIAELRRLCEQATPGPWEMYRSPTDGSYGAGDETYDGLDAYGMYDNGARVLFGSENATAGMVESDFDETGGCHAWDEEARRNFSLIAAARNALPALLDRIEALEAENTVLRGLVQCNPYWRCSYGRGVSHIAECPSGFPGCACADDRLAIMMGGGEAKG